MTCLEFGGIARDYARQEWMAEPTRAEAGRHLAECARCRERLRQQEELDRGMALLRSSEQVLMPPEAARAAVLREFDRFHRERRARVPRRAWAAMAAAAALIGVGSLAWMRTEPSKSIAPVQAKHHLIPDRGIEPAAEMPGVAQARQATAQRPAVAVRRPPRPLQREQVTGFLPIGTRRAVEPGEELRLVRIQLPESELVRFGLPVSPQVEPGYVRADVLLGEDGLARAIRFVY